MNILLIIAMNAEAQGIVSELGLKKESTPFEDFPCSFYKGEFCDHSIQLIANGEYESEPKVSMIGTEAGALAAKLGIDHFKPDLLINLGTAGGKQSSGAKIGETILADRIFFHDRQVGIPGYKERSIGSFSTWERSQKLAAKINVRFENISTGNSFELNEADSMRINEFRSEAKDMEVAAVAWVASLSKVPMMSLKAITDLIDVHEQSSEEQFFANLKTACENLAKKSKELLEAI